jgi:hypothetical protein
MQQQHLFHHPRVTIWDAVIATHNRLASGSDPMIMQATQRISTAEKALLLVEPSPPLIVSTETSTNGAGLIHHAGRITNHNGSTTNRLAQQLPIMDPPVSSFQQYS